MKRIGNSLWLGLVTATAIGAITAPGASRAEGEVKLARPGPCAEPREYGGLGADSAFSVVGPIANLLSPVDVAAAAEIPAQDLPKSPPPPRPGACDVPGSGCGVIPQAVPTNPPIIPGTRPMIPPGTGSHPGYTGRRHRP